MHRAGVECTGSYGAALSRHLHAEAVTAIEVNRADRGNRRRRGKTDTIDAEAAARAVLSGRATAIAKAGDGHVQMLRMFKLAKAKAKGWVRLAATAEPPAPKPQPAEPEYDQPTWAAPRDRATRRSTSTTTAVCRWSRTTEPVSGCELQEPMNRMSRCHPIPRERAK